MVGASSQADTVIPPELVEELRSAQRVAILTGAGVSSESGVPTFRDAQTGLWARYSPEELATRDAFRRQPHVVWEWYEWRRKLVSQAEPNPGHLALVALEKKTPKFTLITQNVDGLHQRAGSQVVIELHGNINRTKCYVEEIIVDEWPDTGEIPPRCPTCGGPLRPDVVWFGEMLPEAALVAAIEASRTCNLFFSIGTSSLVQPAASLPYEAIRRGVVTVEVNPETTPLTELVNYVLRGPVGRVLPALVKATFGEP